MQDSGFQVLLQGNNFLRILQGLGVTIGISIVSVLLSLLTRNTFLGIVMTSKSKIIRFLSRIYRNLFVSCPSWSCSLLFILVWLGTLTSISQASYRLLSSLPFGERLRWVIWCVGQSRRYLDTSFGERKGPWLDQWATLYLCDYSTSLASLVASGY